MLDLILFNLVCWKLGIEWSVAGTWEDPENTVASGEVAGAFCRYYVVCV